MTILVVALNPFTLTIPTAPAPNPRAEGAAADSSTPNPTPATPNPPPASPAPCSQLPAPSAFLHALLTSNFDYAHIAQSLTPEQLLALTQDEAVQKQLQALLTFTNTCLQLKQAQARAVALTELTQVLATTDDPIEKRRAATALLRATDPSRSPHPSSPAPCSPLPAPRSLLPLLPLLRPLPAPNPR